MLHTLYSTVSSTVRRYPDLDWRTDCRVCGRPLMTKSSRPRPRALSILSKTFLAAPHTPSTTSGRFWRRQTRLLRPPTVQGCLVSRSAEGNVTGCSRTNRNNGNHQRNAVREFTLPLGELLSKSRVVTLINKVFLSQLVHPRLRRCSRVAYTR